MTVRVRSFAKINLGLRIGAARADGFHSLLTVYQTIGLHDFVSVRVGRGSGIEIKSNDARVPRDASNTCYRIVEKAMAALKARGRVVIEIEKRLPVQGGLGGASGNAVAALIALERALRKALPQKKRLEIAAEVGSDLPLFLVGGTVLGVGRGERVYPVEDLPSLPCVVVVPEVGVSTPKAFAAWDRLQGLTPSLSSEADAALKGCSSTVVDRNREGAEAVAEDLGPVATELRSAGQPGAAAPTQPRSKLTASPASDKINEFGHEFSAWLSGLHSGAPSIKRRGQVQNLLLELVRAGIDNDFERVVFPEYPELREGKGALVRAGAKYASLSGSGSTLYGLYASQEAAVRGAARLKKLGWAAQATATLTRAQYWKKLPVSGF